MDSVVCRIMLKRISLQKCKLWNKTPFDLGYPILSSELQEEKHRIHKLLFGSQDLEYVDTNSSIYREFVHHQPTKLSGFDLFSQQAQLLAKQKHKRLWKNLSDDTKQSFDTMKNDIYLHLLRIWRGYEVVEYIKRYENKHRFNPYPLLGLYPWEIIKDKLRAKKSPHEFERDYYDNLISESFNRRFMRPETLFRAQDGHGLFRELLVEEKEQFVSLADRRNKFIMSTSRLPKYSSGYLNFYKQNYSDYLPSPKEIRQVPDGKLSVHQRKNAAVSIAAANHWKGLSDHEKVQYSPQDKRIYSHKYKHEILDWKTSMVMDYIYSVGRVRHASLSYNWRNDIKGKFGDWHYLERAYTDRLIYIENGNLHIDRLS